MDKLTDTITVNMEAKEEEENVPAKAPVEEKAPEAPVNEEKAPEPETTYYEVKFFDQIVVDGTLQKAETPITTQWIKDGELAVAPGTVCPEGYAFTGWSGDVNSPITKNTDFVAQYAKVEDSITLRVEYYYEGTNIMVSQPWVATVQPGTFNQTVTFPKVEGCKSYVDGEEKDGYTFTAPRESATVRVDYKGEDAQYQVKHVLLKSDDTEHRVYKTENLTGGINTPTNAVPMEIPGYTVKAVNQASIQKNGTVATVTYAPNAYTITYITGENGSYVAPASVYTDAELPEPETPKRLGYTFAGWTYSAGDGKVMPAQDVTATAKWTANKKAGYTVNYWQESLNGGYELAQKDGVADVVTGTGNVGANINYQAQDDRYKGFHLNTEKSAGNVEITPDGQAVKNVYYDRTEFTIKFYKVTGSLWWVSTEEITEKTITAKYGADISQQWLASADKQMWSTEARGTTYYTTFVNMPAENIECYESKSSGEQNVNYYVETLKSDEYELKQSVGGISYSKLTEEDQQPIEGFTYSQWQKKPSGFYGLGTNDSETYYKNSFWLKYTRNSYAIHFNNCKNVPDATAKFEQPIGSLIPAKAAAPDTVDSDYVFDGWYTAPEGGEKVTSTTEMKMPAHVLQLYARWRKREFTVTYVTNNEDHTADSVKLSKGDEITLPETESWDGFLGWYTDSGFAHPFVEGSQIGKDITLYAKWESDTLSTYTVKYVDEKGTLLQTVPVDKRVTVGTSVIVKADPTIVVDGKTYYPTTTVQTITIAQDAKDNVVVFTCKPVVDWTYTVKYVDDENREIAKSEELHTTDTLVQARAKTIEGYQLKEGEDVVKTLSSNADSKEIVFHYTKNETSYTVRHIDQDTNKKIADDVVVTGVKVGSFVTADPVIVEDYEPVTTGHDLEAAVKGNGSTVITVYYRHCQHTVRYELDSASQELFTGKLPGDEKLRTHEEGTVAPGLTLDGYTFTGWTTNDTTVTGGKYKMPANDVTFVGSFVRDLNTVSVNSIDKTYSGETYSLTVSGTKPEDVVKFYDKEGKEIDNAFRNVEDTQNVTVVVTNGTKRKELHTTVQIAPLAITLSSGSGKWTYDGESHSEKSVTVSGNEFVAGEEPSYSGYASIKDVGSTENTFTYTFPEGVKASNYKITTDYGTLTVEKATAEIKVTDKDGNLIAEGIKRIYDGTTSEVKASTTADDNSKTTYTYLVDGKEVSADELQFKNVVDATVTVKATHPNYTFKDVTVPVQITKRGVTIASQDNSKTYDGTPLTNGEKELTVTNFVDGEGIENIEFTGSITDAGSTPNAFTYTLKKGTLASNYEIAESTGTLTVEKRNVTLTSATDSKTYDGTALTNGEVTVSGDEFAEDEGAAYNVTGTITLPGSVDNEFTYQLNDNTKESNYNITTETGTLTVTDVNDADKYEVTVTANSDKVKYDGNAHTVSGMDKTSFTWKDQTYTISGLSASVSGTEAGTYENKITGTAVVKDASGNDVTAQFKVTTVDGSLTIDKRDVTLTSGSASKTYDGSALTNNTVTVSGDKFVDGEGASYNVTGSITLPGSAVNTFTYKLNDNTKASNYNITTKEGTLTVNDVDDADKYVVTVKAGSDTVKYDGQSHTVSGVDVTTFEWKGHTYTVSGLSASATGTDAGEYVNAVTGTAVVKDESGIDVTNQFKVKTVDGSLVIEKRNVTLTSGSASKVYDGEPLTNDAVDVTGDKFADGEGATYNVTGTITLPGTEDNIFTYKLADGTKASNYNITVVPGKLTVTDVDDADRYEVKVTANSDTVKYDGKSHTVSGVTGTTFEWKGHTYTVTGLSASVTGTNAGTYENKITGTAVVTDASGNDVTAQFKVITVDGSLTIEKRTVVLTSADDSKVYDGKPLSNETVTVTGDGFVYGEEPEYVFSDASKPVNVGTYPNEFTAEISDNYEASFKYGTLTITKAEPSIDVTIDGATIGAEGYTRMYDGTTSGVAATARNQNGDVIDGQFTYSVDGGEATTTAPEFTNSGKWNVTITTGNPNCEEKSVTVSIEITKRHVHMKSADAEKVYDGKAVTGHDSVEITGDGFVAGEEPVFHSFGTYIEAGEYDNTFAYKFNKRPSANIFSRVARYLNPSEDPDHIADNYGITHETGKIVIRKASADLHNLNFEDKTVIYNGKDQMLDAASSDIADAAIQYSVDGKTWTDEMPAFKDAGKYTVHARAVHGNYEDAEKTAVLTVIPAELIVETDSATKEYDGKPLTAGGKLTGVVEGDEITLKMTGSQTEVGKSTNTYELDYGQTKASNYTVTEKLGTLEVTAAPKKEEKPKQDVPTALGLDLNLWTSIMGVSGAAMITTVKLSRKEKNKKK